MISISKDLMSSGNRRRKRPELGLKVDAPRQHGLRGGARGSILPGS